MRLDDGTFLVSTIDQSLEALLAHCPVHSSATASLGVHPVLELGRGPQVPTVQKSTSVQSRRFIGGPGVDSVHEHGSIDLDIVQYPEALTLGVHPGRPQLLSDRVKHLA